MGEGTPETEVEVIGMFNSKQLCNKITSLYPELGECGIDVNISKDHLNNTWVVHLRKGSHKLKHFLEFMDAESCMDGRQCLSLGLDIAQLEKNIEGKQF